MLDTAPDSQWMDKTFAKVMTCNDLSVDVNELPPSLAPLIQALPVEQQMLSLVAVLGQYQHMMFSPTPSQTLSTVPVLPDLAKPMLPCRFWQLAQKCLSALSDGALVALVRLVASRGYGLHPTLWLPTKAFMEHDLTDDLLADLYMPWYVWQLGGSPSQHELTADNWDGWCPAQRLAMLKRWRTNEPSQALKMIQTCLPNTTASERHKIVQVLAINLNAADQAFLHTLQSDRSQKVASVACRLLGRLGVHQDDKNSLHVASELNEGFELTNNKIFAKKTNNLTQQNMRTKLLEQVNIHTWARLNGLTVSEFLSRWDFDKNKHQDNLTFVRNSVDVLNDEQIRTLSECLIAYLPKYTEMELWRVLARRLSPDLKLRFIDGLLQQKDVDFCLLPNICPAALKMEFETLSKTPAYRRFLKKIKAQTLKETGALLNHTTDSDCMALGLLLSGAVATCVLEQLLALGVSRTDPALCTLTLNAKLT